MWPKFSNSSTFMKVVIITSILYEFDQKNHLVRGMVLIQVQQIEIGTRYGREILHTCGAKGLKLRVRKFWVLTPTFAEVTEEKLAGEGLFASHPEEGSDKRSRWQNLVTPQA